MAKTPKKRKPQDITEYALRGIRNDIFDMTARWRGIRNDIADLALRVNSLEQPAAPSLKAALIGAESRSAPVSEDGCGCKTYWDGDTNVTIFCGEHEPGGHDVA